MEKILVRYDQVSHTIIVSKMNRAIKDTQKLVTSINGICDIKIDNTLLKNILFGDGETIANAIEASIIENLERAKINIQSIKKAAIKEALENFYSALKSFIIPHEVSELLSIDESGQVIISDASKEKAEESCKYYITTAKGKEVYDAQERLVNALNDFRTLCPFFLNNPFDPNQVYNFNTDKRKYVANKNFDYDRIGL